MVINTEIERTAVEIDDVEYPVAPKTVDVAQKLIKARAANIGRPEYVLWMAELEILLGHNAVHRLFHSGKNENLDRMERIHAGVCEAFEHPHAELAQEQAADAMRNLDMLHDLLQRVAALEGDKRPVIHGR